MLRVEVTKKLRGVDLDISFKADEGEFCALFGKSGAGKTTLLRILAGLDTPDSGVIEMDGKVWFDSAKNINLPPQKRNIGFVFQDFALFPNMTVRQNLIYALSGKDETIIDELLKLAELTGHADALPTSLSGGQKQRVALIRALARRPKLLLLDEPLSALDAVIRKKLQDELVFIHTRFNPTSILVSHDISEIYRLCGKVFWIESGKLAKSGAPKEVFSSGALSAVFRLRGEILELIEVDISAVATLLVGDDILKVTMLRSEAEGFSVGDSVMIATKAAEPVLMKL